MFPYLICSGMLSFGKVHFSCAIPVFAILSLGRNRNPCFISRDEENLATIRGVLVYSVRFETDSLFALLLRFRHKLCTVFPQVQLSLQNSVGRGLSQACRFLCNHQSANIAICYHHSLFQIHIVHRCCRQYLFRLMFISHIFSILFKIFVPSKQHCSRCRDGTL